MGEIESACVAPCVVLVINDNPYGLMFALRYLYRSCPWRRLEFMCWTLEDGMMTNALFKGLYEEWSCVELSLLQVWLGKEDWVYFMFISKPSSISREEYEAQMDTWRRSLARLSHNGVWGSIWRSLHQACASKHNQERCSNLRESRLSSSSSSGMRKAKVWSW